MIDLLKNKKLNEKIIFFNIFIFLVFFDSVCAQQQYTINGYVRDAKTGEELIGATVSIKELSGKGASTNAYGFYSLTIPSGHYQVMAQYIGYQPQIQQIDLNTSIKIDFSLSEKVNDLEEVVITSQRKDENVMKTQNGFAKVGC